MPKIEIMINDSLMISAAQIHKLKTYTRHGKYYKQNGRWYTSGYSRYRTFGKFEKAFIDTLRPGQEFNSKNGFSFLKSLLITAYEEQKQ